MRCITDAGGAVEYKLGFDAWGNRRNPETGEMLTAAPAGIFTARGFTGHEHLDAFGLINMNGRVYDPVISMFLSPDPYIQAPDMTQNFNRYSYCLNNPLMYTDPSGEFIHLIIGAAIGGIVNWATHGFKLTWKGLGYFGVGAIAGAIGAGIGGGISSSLSIAGKTAGGFAAGFWGTSAATTATTSFVSGLAIGAGTGGANGFLGGFGNALVDGKRIDTALGKGLVGGLIGGFSGGAFGGMAGGFDAVFHGRRFFDGATVHNKFYADVTVEGVRQVGNNNCLPASGESIDKSLGGSTTQQQLRASAGGSADTDPLNVRNFWEKSYTNTTGAKAELGDLTDVVPTLQGGGRIAASLPPVDGVGHSVVIQKVYLQTVIKVNGTATSTVMYRIMDPATGGFRNVSFKDLNWYVFRIFK